MSTEYHGIHPDDDPELFGADEFSNSPPKPVIDGQIPLPGDPPSHEDDWISGRLRN